ncbi:MAG TPA: hypothetical protein ENI76_00470 [Ignavibacteria bacterium]|nr:hypothetical protein [Ignavibacteria bacterium]
MNKKILSIKKQTRLALPEDDTYLYRLGIALYGFNSINSFMIEIICHIDDRQNQIKLFELESGKILEEFRKTLSYVKKNKLFPVIYLAMSKTANLFEGLNTERSDFIHSYPITNKKNEQILHRRKDSKGKYFEINNDFLDNFVSRLHDVSSLLYKIRSTVKSQL